MARATAKVTDPRPIPTPSIWAVLVATLVPALYVLWVGIAIPITGSTDVSAAEELSFTILSVVVLAAAVIAVALGAVGVAIVRQDPHLFRWQWVGWLAVTLGTIETIAYTGGWLDWWPRL